VASAARQDAAHRPGKGRIISDEEIKSELATKHPYTHWLSNTQLILEELKPVEPRALRKDVSLLDRQQAFGYTRKTPSS
jgi:glutamate synthase (NADPH/NADH) large chain